MTNQQVKFMFHADVAGFNDTMYELEKRLEWIANLRPDEPCDHRGCLSHHTHPCEGCGRIAGQWSGKVAAMSSAVTVQNRLRFLLP